MPGLTACPACVPLADLTSARQRMVSKGKGHACSAPTVGANGPLEYADPRDRRPQQRRPRSLLSPPLYFSHTMLAPLFLSLSVLALF